MRRLWPAAESAWRVGMSVGRAARPRAATPADTAPLVTISARWPALRRLTTSRHSFTTAPRSITPRSSVNADEPIFATTVFMAPRSVAQRLSATRASDALALHPLPEPAPRRERLGQLDRGEGAAAALDSCAVGRPGQGVDDVPAVE